MSKITTIINSNHLKNQYRNQQSAPEFDMDNSHSIAVERKENSGAGPAAILTLSPQARALLAMKREKGSEVVDNEASLPR